VSQVYSTRFIVRGEAKGWLYYTVPAGKRAVIKVMTAYNTVAVTSKVILSIKGYYVYAGTCPASGGFLQLNTAQVAYAGEQIGQWNEQDNCHTMVSGYLLNDP